MKGPPAHARCPASSAYRPSGADLPRPPAGAADGEQASHPVHRVLGDGEGPPAQLVGRHHRMAELRCQRFSCRHRGGRRASGSKGGGWVASPGGNQAALLRAHWHGTATSTALQHAPASSSSSSSNDCQQQQPAAAAAADQLTGEVEGVEGLVGDRGADAVEPRAAVVGARRRERRARQLLRVQVVGADAGVVLPLGQRPRQRLALCLVACVCVWGGGPKRWSAQAVSGQAVRGRCASAARAGWLLAVTRSQQICMLTSSVRACCRTARSLRGPARAPRRLPLFPSAVLPRRSKPPRTRTKAIQVAQIPWWRPRGRDRHHFS